MAEREQYIGFSTVDRDEPPFRLTEIDLIKRDLLNAFYTRRGERVMRPDFGTIIFDLLFDPFDEETKAEVIEDAINIISRDPRVQLVSIDARELEEVLRLDIELRFTPQDVVEQLFIEYDRQNREAI